MNDIRTQSINLLLDKMVNNAIEYSAPDRVIAYLLVYGDQPLVKETDEHLMDMVWDEYGDEINDLDEFSVKNWIMKQTPYNWLGQM